MKNIHTLPTEKPSRFYSTAQTETKKRGYAFGEHYIPNTRNMFSNHNIYITSDEEIKDVRPHKGKWQLEQGHILNKFPTYLTDLSECKLVIMTTDQDLIEDGVQAIDDEFLKWFVKNPSCEWVEVKSYYETLQDGLTFDRICYKIIIPKEEPKQDLEKEMFELEQELDIPSHLRWHNSKPKQETLEEAAEKLTNDFPALEVRFNMTNEEIHGWFLEALQKGAKWQQEQDKNKYSEEDLKQFAFECVGNFLSNRENELEIELVNVISDRNNKLFEKFKNK